MKENTPPASPYDDQEEEEDDDDDLVYVGDNIDDVIEHLEEFPDNQEISDEGEQCDSYKGLFAYIFIFKMMKWRKMTTFCLKETTQY